MQFDTVEPLTQTPPPAHPLESGPADLSTISVILTAGPPPPPLDGVLETILAENPQPTQAAARNRAAIRARGTLLLFLDAAHPLPPGAIAAMARLAARPGVGIVGPRGLPLLDAFSGATPPHNSQQRNEAAIAWPVQMIRRDVFDQLGGYDEAFAGPLCGVALALRAARLGFRTAVCPEADTAAEHPPTILDPEDRARLAREMRRLGFDADPYAPNTLRAPGDPSPTQALHQALCEALAAEILDPSPLDLYDDTAILAATGLPRDLVLPPLAPVTDTWTAASWIIELLRRRPDIRARFPRALSHAAAGPFATWLDHGADGIALPPGLHEHLPALWASAPADRARSLYFWREDVRHRLPVALLPVGSHGLARWLFRHGTAEYALRPEEAWWLLLANDEDPARELIRLCRFTPAWQARHPLALTPAGHAAFAAWFAREYEVAGTQAWLDPATWPDLPDAADQARLLALHRNDAPPPGLAATVLGHFCYPSGLRVSVEALSDAMQHAGIAVARRDLRTRIDDDPRHTSFGGLESAPVTIIHTQPEPFFAKAHERADLAPRTPAPYRIAYWYWELEDAPPSWAEAAATVDEVWVATEFVARAVRRVAHRPVHVLFPGVRLAPFTPRTLASFGLPDRGQPRFTFLFSFHMASVMERKNPLGLIRAFRAAFSPDEPVDLVIKTTSDPTHAADRAALHAAAAGPNVFILDRVLGAEDTLALTAACDAYVSLHRSEGLGLTMAEAMLLAKPVIATRYSGNLDFMDDGNALLVDCTLQPLGRPIPPYAAAARWAAPDEAHAARLMRHLVDHPIEAASLGRRAQASARASMSLEAAGARIAARLAAIRDCPHSPAH